MPAVHILHAPLRSWAWREQRHFNRFVAREAVPLDVPSDLERLALQVIHTCGGVATWQQLNDALAARGFTLEAVSGTLQQGQNSNALPALEMPRISSWPPVVREAARGSTGLRHPAQADPSARPRHPALPCPAPLEAARPFQCAGMNPGARSTGDAAAFWPALADHPSPSMSKICRHRVCPCAAPVRVKK